MASYRARLLAWQLGKKQPKPIIDFTQTQAFEQKHAPKAEEDKGTTYVFGMPVRKAKGH
jgi:hypothetical protein